MNNDTRFFRQHREKIVLFVYFVVMTAGVGLLVQTLGTGWRRAGLFLSLAGAIDMYTGVGLEQLSAVGFGVFVGLLVLITGDPKKRWQGLLLWIALVTGLIGLQSIGLFLPNIDFVANVGWLIGGIVFGLSIGGGRQLVEQSMQRQTSQALEFRRASTGAFVLLTVVVVLMILEYHIQYGPIVAIDRGANEILIYPDRFSLTIIQESLLQNVVLGSVFVVTLRRFIQYDAERTFFVLGPKESGKSMFLLGMFLEAQQRVDDAGFANPLRPSNALLGMIDRLDSRSRGWVLDATDTGEIQDLHFRYIHGRVFPKNLVVEGIDYAGEYLEDIPDALLFPDEVDDQQLIGIADRVRGADTLILIIDAGRFSGEDDLDIAPYPSILEECPDTEVILVATKADILAEEFEEDEGLRAPRDFDEFRRYVNDRLTNNRVVRTIVQETAGAEIHPVYYQTTRENGELVPQRDADNNLMTVGYDELLDELGR
ncbi:hypothetical protein [Salinigranum halophilum]|uniref:hypothetical protein n=1 Tax=Salinigranum halophilum TaxID=2565931 RepID=UPI0010A8D6B8|nr:hypothetical protein [Salinigranum halophilum]